MGPDAEWKNSTPRFYWIQLLFPRQYRRQHPSYTLGNPNCRTSFKSLPKQSTIMIGEIQQHHIRALLHSFEDDFMAVRGDVEVADIEV